MKKVIVSFLFLLIVVPFFAERAFACTCMNNPSPCESFKATPIVFVGLVKSVKEDRIDIQRFGRQVNIRVGLLAHFIIEEPLKGIEKGEVDLMTGGGGGDCGYPFKEGERYLVYAYKSEGQALESSASRTVFGGGSSLRQAGALSTSICSRTMLLSSAQDDLDLIRSLIKGKPQNRIFGDVTEYVSTFGETVNSNGNYLPKAGVVIKAEGSAGKYEAVTDVKGHFKLNDLKSGKYKVRLIVPMNYGMQFSFERTEYDVEVLAGCWGVGLDFTVKVNGRISGRIFDDQGKSVGRQVEVSIITADSVSKGKSGIKGRSEYTNQQGEYEFYGVPAGRFVLGVNLSDVPDKGTPYAATYFPSGSAFTERAIIDLKVGEKRDGLDIHLPPRLEEVIVTGIVVKSDGTPAADARVQIYDSEKLDRTVFGLDVNTDSKGRFTLKILKGRRYQLHAYLDKDYLAGTGDQSEMIEINPTDADKPVKIVLSKPGIFRERE